MKPLAQTLFLVTSFLVALDAQTVSGQVTTSPPPQTATATAKFKKVIKLVATLGCPGVPTDPTTGEYLVLPGTAVTCAYTLNIAPTVATTIQSSSSDTTQFTVPTSVPIAAGSFVSANFLVTATP